MRGLVLDIGMEINRRDRDDQVFHLFWMQRGVTRRKDAALADTEKRDPIVPGLLRDAIDGGIDVVVHVVVDGQPPLGSARPAPVDQPEIEPLRQQAAHQRAIGLKISHGVSADQAVGYKDGRPCRRVRHRFVVEQLHLVAAHDEMFRRRADVDILVSRVRNELRRLEDFFGVGRYVAGKARGMVLLITHGVPSIFWSRT